MANPILPSWEYIPDGEPYVFGDRVYLYGSHDRPGANTFCDIMLKCWSAPIDNLNEWTCHGTIFRLKQEGVFAPDATHWENPDCMCYAPDVMEHNGKYYLYVYIFGAPGCVAVSDRPEGPFKEVHRYDSSISKEITCNDWFIDPGTLSDDDGRVYVACGFERSFMAELDSKEPWKVVEGSCLEHVIPNQVTEEGGYDTVDKIFFEGASLRKIGDTYYMIYSPKRGSRLAYATSKSPMGPYTYRGWIVDNGVDYPGGNDHGSIACINGQWYIFYHRMTNGTIMSRRACAEKIEILPDGTIPSVEMTSLGFADTLNPYRETPAELACVLLNGATIYEKDLFTRVVGSITNGSVIGYKYFDFGKDNGNSYLKLKLKVRGQGLISKLRVCLDKEGLEEIGSCQIGVGDGVVSCEVKMLEGKHPIFFHCDGIYEGWVGDGVRSRSLFELESFVFVK